MQKLVASRDGELTTTSLIIAEGTHNEHRNVIRLIRKYQHDLEAFGRVDFKNQTFETAGGPQAREIAILNREQSMFVMTLFRNNPVVVGFKKNLIKAFVDMEKQLEAASMFDPAALTRAEILQIALNAEEERLELEAKNQELEPKAEAYDAFLNEEGNYSVGVVAKMLGMGQNKLFRELRNAGVLISKGHLYNTPYQKYMHHFDVTHDPFRKPNGEWGVNHKTYVQPSGVNFIRKKLQLETIDPLPSSDYQGYPHEGLFH